MSQSVETPTKTFEAGAALAQFLRVKLSSAKLALAGAAEADIGVMEKPAFADGDMTAVRLRTAQGTVKMVASAAVSAEAVVYGASSGKISSTPNGNPVGIALEAAGADNDIIEVLRVDAIEEGSGDDAPFVFGSGADAEMLWSTADADNHALVLAIGDASQALHIADVGAKATDWNVSADTHPTVYIHSNTTPATDYLKIGAHDGSGSWGADMVGGAALYFGFDGLEALELAEVASAVNHVRIAPATTGNKPVITNQGEADTGLIIAGFDGANTEEILIFDAIATAVNEVTIANAATGNNPSVAASGDNTDITLEVTGKGTGGVELQVGGTTHATLKANNLEIGDAADAAANSVEIFDGGSEKPGMLVLYDHAGAAHYLWVDNTGDLRVHTSVPTDEDSDGTIVGTQS